MLLCFVFTLPVFAQLPSESSELKLAKAEFDNGNFLSAVDLSNAGFEKTKIRGGSTLAANWLEIKAGSEISIGKYDDAAKTLDAALEILADNSAADANVQRARIYIQYAWLYKSQRKFTESFNYSKKAILAAPDDHAILGAYYLNTGRILFTSGFDVSAIIWLEKAENLLISEGMSSAKIDTYRFLSLAWKSKLDYKAALKYAEKCVSVAEKSQFKHKHRQGLFDLATILSGSGREHQALLILEQGLTLSTDEHDSEQAGNFLTSLLLHALDRGNVGRASEYLNRLEKLKGSDQFSFEIGLGKAVLAAYQGQAELSDRLFTDLEKNEKPSEYTIPYWKIAIAERNENWDQSARLNQDLLELTKKDNFRSGLPKIYLNLALAYFHLGQPQKSQANLEASLAYIEELRKGENANSSLGFSETYHNAYRLLAQLKLENPQESFKLSDFLKARLLNDLINRAAIKTQTAISPEIRRKLEDLSLKYINDESVGDEIDRNEKLITNTIPDLNLVKPSLIELNNLPDLRDTAVISYFFTLDKKLIAFVWEKDKPLQTVYLPITEDLADVYARKTHEKIKDLIFFKKDGKELYDKLLKPLNISAKNMVFVPDKSLWKIPFQALSPDGEKYLIETATITYAPSVSILLEQLRSPRPTRKTFQAFASPSYNNQVLQYANAEANSVSELYNSKPILNATVADFEQISDKFGILHFSMHAQVNNDQPLESFLAFKQLGKNDGRLTVEDLLKIKLMKGSLVFLASCDTNNVLNGEGLVSLAWAMIGSGATTVISAQWEANDKSTEIFTRTFYRYYKGGSSSAEALQKASLEMIKNKTTNMHEPYYWADFVLIGDFR
jgi:CHAT domain-containing protein